MLCLVKCPNCHREIQVESEWKNQQLGCCFCQKQFILTETLLHGNYGQSVDKKTGSAAAEEVSATNSLFNKCMDFTSRASRVEFAKVMIWYELIYFFMLFTLMIFGDSIISVLISLVCILVFICATLPIISLTVRRLHDINMPWPMIFPTMMFFPIAKYILLFVPQYRHENPWGLPRSIDPVDYSVALVILEGVTALIFTVILMICL